MGHYLSEMESNDKSEHLEPKKARKVHSIKDMCKEIPLETRLFVTNHMLILTYLVDNGFIPDGFWTDEKEEKYGESLSKFAKKLAKIQMKEMNEWEQDGKPQ